MLEKEAWRCIQMGHDAGTLRLDVSKWGMMLEQRGLEMSPNGA